MRGRGLVQVRAPRAEGEVVPNSCASNSDAARDCATQNRVSHRGPLTEKWMHPSRMLPLERELFRRESSTTCWNESVQASYGVDGRCMCADSEPASDAASGEAVDGHDGAMEALLRKAVAEPADAFREALASSDPQSRQRLLVLLRKADAWGYLCWRKLFGAQPPPGVLASIACCARIEPHPNNGWRSYHAQRVPNGLPRSRPVV